MTAPTHAEEPAADDVETSLILGGGPGWTFARDSYHSDPIPIDPVGPPLTSTADAAGGVGYAELTVVGRVDPNVWLGGLARFDWSGMAEAPSSNLTTQIGNTLGPLIRIQTAEGDGAYFEAWVGAVIRFAFYTDLGFGVGAGYQWALGDGWRLGLGGALDTVWVFEYAGGDSGHYESLYGAVWPAFQARISH